MHIAGTITLGVLAFSFHPDIEGPVAERILNADLQRYVTEKVLPAVQLIPAERKEALDLIAAYVRERKDAGVPADLTFICTHNSRRSHLAQLWAATAAWQNGLDHVRSFSGGTEATAFNPRAVAAIERAGFAIVRPEGTNPRYELSFALGAPVQTCWSKTYGDPANPSEGFCAVMTCSQADAACPTVQGALDRISLPYDDPKVADGTPQEAQRYDERCLQIAAEMFYIMQQAGR